MRRPHLVNIQHRGLDGSQQQQENTKNTQDSGLWGQEPGTSDLNSTQKKYFLILQWIFG